jgi:hypothetical protein
MRVKVRIRGDFLRLRLTRGEVSGLAEAGRVDEAIHFGADQVLGYRLEVDPEVTAPTAELDLGAAGLSALIRVRLPRDLALAWAEHPERVGIDATCPAGGERQLRILVEKDFACLVPRGDGQEDADTFPHPKTGRSAIDP